LRVPIAIRAFYESYLWILQTLLLTHPDLHPGLLGDLLEEFSHLASKSGVAFARSWYWRQTAKTIAHLVRTGFRVAPWSTTVAVVGAFYLGRFIFGLPERVIFAVLERYRVFDHHFNAYVFFASTGIAIGRVITSMFVGCIVAVAAKRKEMVAAMMLGLVHAVLCGVAILATVPWGRPFFWGTLPWQFGDWVAIVVGGAIVRKTRSAVERRSLRA
jgi:hypothetical protein